MHARTQPYSYSYMREEELKEGGKLCFPRSLTHEVVDWHLGKRDRYKLLL